MLDLFAGLGGFSEAFISDDDWSVLRIDNNILLQDVPRMFIADIMTLDIHNKFGLESTQSIDLIAAGPPCLEFSNAYNGPKYRALREGRDYYPHGGMACAKKVKKIIDLIQPQFWIVENVVGSIKYLNEIFGEYKQIEGPHVFWGNYPTWTVENLVHKKKGNKASGQDPLSVQKRGLIPIEISRSIKNAVESQVSLMRWI